MFIFPKTTNHSYNFFFGSHMVRKKKKQKDQKDGNLDPDGKREDEKEDEDGIVSTDQRKQEITMKVI